MTSFGARLRELRIERNLKQEELANHIGRSKVTISQYERDVRQTDDATKKMLADYFNVTVDYLLGITDMKRYPKTGESEEKKEKIAQMLDDILEKHNIVKPGEDLDDEQVEWLMTLVDKAIDMTKI